MKGRPRKLPSTRRSKVIAGVAPDPSIGDADDEAISERLSNPEKQELATRVIEHIERHAQAHGSFSGLADFLAQCDQLIEATRATRGKLTVTSANSLARDVSSLREIIEALPPEMRGLIYRGVTTGFLFSNLKHELAAGKERK